MALLVVSTTTSPKIKHVSSSTSPKIKQTLSSFITNITKCQTHFITNITKDQTRFIINITKEQTQLIIFHHQHHQKSDSVHQQHHHRQCMSSSPPPPTPPPPLTPALEAGNMKASGALNSLKSPITCGKNPEKPKNMHLAWGRVRLREHEQQSPTSRSLRCFLLNDLVQILVLNGNPLTSALSGFSAQDCKTFLRNWRSTQACYSGAATCDYTVYTCWQKGGLLPVLGSQDLIGWVHQGLFQEKDRVVSHPRYTTVTTV